MMMLSLPWLVALLACVLIVPGAYAIEVSISAGDGGESVSLASSYDVGDDVAVSEESTVSGGQLGIENSRSVSGTGDINAIQSYSGSGGYAGDAVLNAEGVSGTLQSNALLTPQSVGATQGLSLSGNSVDTSMSLANEGDSASLGVEISSGSIESTQGIQTGSVGNRLNSVINSPWARISKQTFFQGNKDITTTILKNSKSEPVSCKISADSYGGSDSSLNGGENIDEKIEVSGIGSSKAKIETVVENGENVDYRCTNVPGQIIGRTLTVESADSIYAKAEVTSGMSDSVPVSIRISKDWFFGNRGSLTGYENGVSFDGSKATATQKFSKAEGDNIILNQANDLAENSKWDFGGDSYTKITKGTVEGYKNSASIERSGTGAVSGTTSQHIDYANGNNLEIGTYAFDNVGKDSANIVTKVKSGSISSYDDMSTAKTGETTATIGKSTGNVGINAKGSEIEISSHAENKALSIQFSPTLVNPDYVYDYLGGSADFVVKRKNNDALNNAIVDTSATSNDVKIEGAGSLSKTEAKSVLILEPFRDAFGLGTIGFVLSPIFDSPANSLVDKGYAVTVYADAGVSKDMITKQLGDYDISIVRTHGSPDGLEFSRFSEMNGDKENRGIWPNEFTKFKSNDMIIIDGCSAFGLNGNNERLIAESVSSAKVSGGFTLDVFALTDASFMTNFFNSLCEGDTVKQANDKNKQVAKWGFTNLLLQGDENYRLFSSSSWTVNPGDLIQDYIEKAKSGDTITISPGIFNENLRIDKSLTLKGARNSDSGTIVDGNGLGSVISIIPDQDAFGLISVNLYDMLIRGGSSTLGGGIYNLGTLNVEDCTISGNKATEKGGGIYNGGTMTISSSTIKDNRAGSSTTEGYGGGIYNDGTIGSGTLLLHDSTISDNIAGRDFKSESYTGVNSCGGGVYNTAGTVTMNGGTISGNSATSGGGLFNRGTADKIGTLTINGGTVSGNKADIFGGGITNGFHGTLRVEGGSTISGNTIPVNLMGCGGGISNSGDATVIDSVISENIVHLHGGGIYNSGKLYLGGTTQIVGNQAKRYYGGGVYSDGIISMTSVTFDGTGVAVKSNKAGKPASQSSWYQGWGVNLNNGVPITINGFDPAMQVTGNTRYLNLPEWQELTPLA